MRSCIGLYKRVTHLSSTSPTSVRSFKTAIVPATMNIIPKSSDDKSSISSSDNAPNNVSNIQYKGQMAFADCEIQPITDLFLQYARRDKLQDQGGCYLTIDGVKELLSSIGERRNDETVAEFFQAADLNNDGKLHLHEFLRAADQVLSKSPARIVLVVGGPGSGKGILCDRMAQECNAVHLSSGEMLREEIKKGTPLGFEVKDIIERGELVSSALMTALIRRRMRDYPGRRVLLDGFPRSLENALDFADLIGKPELALHLNCDDTILMERILMRAKEQSKNGGRSDDNIETALRRLRNYHKAQKPTMDWLREQHIPIVNLDVSGTPESVWNQLLSIGRLMRPVALKASNESPQWDV